MDYKLEIILIALIAHRQIDGGQEESVTVYANDLFGRFDKHIRDAAEAANLDADETVRSILAAIATLVPGGTPKECAREAVATYVDLFGN